jgi:glutamine synthetase
MAGIIKHARSFSAVTNPTVNSYKRLVPGYEAPVNIAWSTANRSCLVRIPAKRGMSTRIEVRNPDPTCNPYLGLAVMLAAGLDGMNKKMVAPPAVDRNIYHMDDDERIALGMESMPGSLLEAVYELDKNQLIKDALGPHIYEKFRENKMKEWQEYNIQVSAWEIAQYLTKF